MSLRHLVPTLVVLLVLVSPTVEAQQGDQYALFLNGSYVSLPPYTTDNALTVEGWVFLRQLKQGTGTIIEYARGFGRDAIALEFELGAGKEIIVRARVSSGNRVALIRSGSTFTPRLWAHVAMVVSEEWCEIYINGRIEGSGNVPSIAGMTRQTHYIGKSSGFLPQYFDGMIDDLRIWRTKRTQALIRQFMEVDVQLPDDNLRSLFKFNDFETHESVRDIARGEDGRLFCVHGGSCFVSIPASKAICGDGLRSGSGIYAEQCDDGNNQNGDGCSSSCQVESGYFCRSGKPGGTDVCLEGTAVAEEGFESSSAGWMISVGNGNPTIGKGAWEPAFEARRFGEAGLRLFQPRMYESDESGLPSWPFMWFRSDEGVTVQGGRVVSWADRSGNGKLFTLASGTQGATINPTGANGHPSLRFTDSQTENTGYELADDSSIGNPYTMAAFTRYWKPGGNTGRIISSKTQDFRFGLTDGRVAFHNSGDGWCRFRPESIVEYHPDPDRSTHIYYRADVLTWYLTVGVVGPSVNPGSVSLSMWRDSIQSCQRERGSYPSAPGKIVLGSGGTTSSRSNTEISELIVYNRTLDEEERQALEDYFGTRYNHHSRPAMKRTLRRLQGLSASDFITWGHRLLSTSLSSSMYLQYAVNLRSIPERVALPLVVILFDTAASVPSPLQCTSSNFCGGFRFYSLCYNGGNGIVHCDEVVTLRRGLWSLQSVDVYDKFLTKYGGTPPSALRLALGIQGSDEDAEAWIDDIALLDLDSRPICPKVEIDLLGYTSFSEAVLRDMPRVLYKLGSSSSITDEAQGNWEVSGSPPAATISGNPTTEGSLLGDANPSLGFVYPNSFITVNLQDSIDRNRGFTGLFWLQVSSTPSSDTGLIGDMANGGGSFRVFLGTDLHVYASIKTSQGTTVIKTPSAITLNSPGFIGVMYNPAFSHFKIYLNAIGDPVHVSGPNPNRGDFTPASQFFIGKDGVATGNTKVIIDEFAWFSRVLTRVKLYEYWSTYNPTAPSHAKLTLAGVPSNLPAGATVLVMNSDGTTIEDQQTFDVTSATNGQSQVDSLTSHLDSIADDKIVAVILNSEGDVDRHLLYSEDWNRTTQAQNPPLNNQAVYLGDVSYRIYRTISNDWPDKTWFGARDYCQSLGFDLCARKDYCYLFGVQAANPSTIYGEVEGDGWAPTSDSENSWVAVGRAYDNRVCRYYEDVHGSKPAFGAANGAGSPGSPLLCCSKWETPWKLQVQSRNTRHHYWHDDPYFAYEGNRLRSASYFANTPSDHYYWRSDATTGRCSNYIDGMYMVLDDPVAKTWTDYTVEAFIYTHVRDVGVLFRWTNDANSYAFLFNGDPDIECHGFVTYSSTGDSTDLPNRVIRRKTNNGAGAEKPFIPRYTWGTLRLEVRDNVFKVYWDGVLMNSFTDTARTHTQGTIGFWTAYNAHVRVTDVRVYAHPPIHTKALNEALEKLHMPSMNLGSFSFTPPARLRGVSYAAFGRKVADTSPMAAMSYMSGSGLSGDRAIKLRNLFECVSAQVAVPENSPVGTFLSYAVPVAQGRDASDFTIEGGNEDGIFAIEGETGMLKVVKAAIDYEGKSSYTLAISAAPKGYDSGWFPLQSIDGTRSFKELSVTGNLPTVDIAHRRMVVQLRAADGPNQGFIFGSIGASIYDDDYSDWARWGGVIAAYDQTKVRLWAPNYRHYQGGSIIKLGLGSGAVFSNEFEWLGEKNVQMSHTAQVRVLMYELSSPDYDSGWFEFNSQDAYYSFKDIPHGFPGIPDEVRMLVRSIDDPNRHFVFEGRSFTQTQDWWGDYGGITYLPHSQFIRLRAPSREHGAWFGYSVFIGMGWGDDNYFQASVESQVRVQAWKERTPPQFSVPFGPVSLVADQECYTDITFGQNDNVASEGGLTNVTTLGLDVLPGHFSVRMKPSAGSDWALDATGMLQNHGIIWWNGHDGVTFAYNGSQVRLWMPSVDANLDIFPVTRNRPWRNYYGWARGWGGTESSTAVMGIKVWGARPYAKRDTMAFNVEVSNLREPPIAKDSVVQLSEAVAGTTLNGNEVIKVTATDDDIGDTLTFSIISGNTGYAFAIDSGTGMITVNNSDMIDYETYPFFHLAISISDQIFSTVSMVTVEVLDVNDPCTVFPAEMEAEENLPENALVGDVIQAYDPDVDQTLLFSIVGGNWNESFGINPCSGQIYVNYPSLNYELYPVYNLTVMVTDDGVPPTSDTAQVIIQLIDVNDKPYFLGRTMFVSENLLAGQVASILPVHDEDNDTLAFKFISGNSVGYFDIAIDGLDPITLHPQYVLRMSDKVVATGDGTARLADGTRDPTVPLDALVLNYEDPLRSNPIFKMKIYVVDDSNVPLDDRSAAETFTVYIVDENDPIRADAKQTLTISEDALPSSFVGRGIRTEDEDRLFWNGVARSDDPVFAMVDSPPDLPFELEETTGQIVLTNELDYESDAFYYFNVTAADQGGIVRFIQVTIAIDDVNEPPFLANQTFTPDENQQAGFVIGKLMADDPDFDEKLNYTIVSGDPDKLFAIAPGNDGELALRKDGLDYEAVSEYELNVTVTDKDGVTVWAYVWIEVVNKNDPPSFSSCPAPEDRDVVWDRRPAFSAIQGLIVQPGLITDLDNLFDLASGTTVASVDECESACEQNLDCAAYTFFDADYELTNWQGHCYGRSGFQNTMAPITLPDLSPDSSVQSGLRVQACIAEHLAENTPPSDPDDLHDNVITVEDFEADPFDVAIVSGNPDGAFELVEITPSTFRVKIARDVLDFETTPLYLLELEAVDSSNSTASVVYAITIDDVNEPPVLLPANLSVREFDSAGLRVGLPIGVWDPDVSHGDSVTFSLTSATNPSFDIETETGQLLLVQDIPSGIAPTTFQLTITATDSKGLTDVRTYDVSVSDTNAYPEFNADNLAAARTVMENAVAGTEVLPRVIVTDENVEDTLTYTMLKITPEVEGRKLFALDSATGHITLKDVSALNYECSRRSPRPNCPEPYRQFNMTIRVEDDAVDQLGAEAFILIDIADVSEAPIHPSAITVEINETYPSGTRLLYAPSITIPSNPVIIPDYYDDDRDIISYSLDPAVFAGGAIEFSVASVSAYDYDHLLPFALPIAVSNPYNTFPEQQTPLFTLVRGDLDHEAQGSYSTTLKMSDGEHNIDIPVTIVVADVPERPYFEEDSYAFDVDENSPGGLTIGRVTALDPDTDDVIFYSLKEVIEYYYDGTSTEEQEDKATRQFVERFRVDVSTGEITLRYPKGSANSVLDYENHVGYRLLIEARDRDAGGLTTTTYVNITVNDVNDLVISRIDTGGKYLRTRGGDGVRIIGANFGPLKGDPDLKPVVEYRCNDAEVRDAAAEAGEPFDPEDVTCLYTAANCYVETFNIIVYCDSSEGTGIMQSWKITIGGFSAISRRESHSPENPTLTSYIPPFISSLSAPLLTTQGGELVDITGENFGPSSSPYAFAAVYNGKYTAVGCEVVDHEHAKCTSVPGIGKNHWWQVSIDQQSSLTKEEYLARNDDTGGTSSVTTIPPELLTSYLPPRITSIESGPGVVLDILDTRGGQDIVILGQNFGPATGAGHGFALAVASNGVFENVLSCTNDATTPHQKLRCKTAPGVGTSYELMVEVGAQWSGFSLTSVAYIAPEISEVLGDGAYGSPTEGGSRIFVKGQNFGPVTMAAAGTLNRTRAGLPAQVAPNTIDEVRYGRLDRDKSTWFTAQECRVFTAFSQLECETGPGTGANLTWYISVGGLLSGDLEANTFYGDPVITNFDGEAAPAGSTVGDQHLEIHGFNFGNDVSRIEFVSYGPTGIEFEATDIELIEDHKQLRVKTVPGAGFAMKVLVKVDGLLSSVPRTTYQRPDIHSLGGQQLVIHGTNFGTPVYLDYVGVGDYRLGTSRCQVTTPHSTVTCVMPPGVGGDLQVFVHVEGQESNPNVTAKVWYAPPEILAMTLIRPGRPLEDLDTSRIPTGGSLLRLVGSDFGRRIDGLNVTAGVEYETKDFIDWDYAEVTCVGTLLPNGSAVTYPGYYCLDIVIPEGDGLNRGITVQVGKRTSNMVHFSYGLPFIKAQSVKEEAASNGLNKILGLNGENFGKRGIVKLALGNVTDLDVIFNSPAPPSTIDLPQYYEDLKNDVPVTQYAVECITNPNDPRLVGVTNETELYYSHEEIRCFIPGINANAIQSASVAIQSGVDELRSNIKFVNDISPLIDAYDPPRSPTFPVERLEILGTYFGSLDSLRQNRDALTVEIGGRDCPIDLEASIELDDAGVPCQPGVECQREKRKARIYCAIPPGEGANETLIVYRYGDPSFPEYFSYDPPTLECLALPDGECYDLNAPGKKPSYSTSGEDYIYMKGNNFGTTQVVWFSGQELLDVEDVSPNDKPHTLIRVGLPEGKGRGHLVYLQVKDQFTSSGIIHYDPPKLSPADSSPGTMLGGTTGGMRLVLRGKNFGKYDESTHIYIGPYRLPIVAWDHEEIVADTTPGQGARLPIRVHVGGQMNNEEELKFSYRPPSLLSVDPLTGPTSGMDENDEFITIELEGSNFGTHPVVEFGGKLYSSVDPDAEIEYANSTHDYLAFKLPAGQGNTTFKVWAGDQTHEQVFVFNYEHPELYRILAPGLRTDACTSYEDLGEYRERLNKLVSLGKPFRERLCCAPQVIRLQGKNFGSPAHPPTIHLSLPNLLAAGQDRNVIVNAMCDPRKDQNKTGVVDSRLHCVPRNEPCILRMYRSPGGLEEIRIRAVPGQGLDNPMYATIHWPFHGSPSSATSLSTDTFNVSYGAPYIQYVFPRVVKLPVGIYASESGSLTEFTGENFGEVSPIRSANSVDILLDEEPCINSRLEVDSEALYPRHDGLPFLSCGVPGTITAGYHNITLSVAGQTATFPKKLVAECPSGTYGQYGEICLVCPVGGDCSLGGTNEPTSLPEYWREEIVDPDAYDGTAIQGRVVSLDERYNERCPPERQSRDTCPFFAACIPPYACLKNNTCAPGYEPTSIRCSECIKGKFHRVAGDCVPCPDNPEIILIAFLLIVILVLILVYWLDRKKINLGVLNIGIDYFQVLAILSSAKVPWPNVLEGFLRFLTVFNLNIDIAAPECLMPDLDFRYKFLATQFVPLSILGILFVMLAFQMVYVKLIKRQSASFAEHYPTVISLFLTLMNIMYLFLSRSILDIFNCNTPPQNDQGISYMESTALPCWEGAHMSIVPAAFGFLFMYTVGYPILAALILYKNRLTIAKDQLLRCAEAPEMPSVMSEGTYMVRRKFRRLYYLFRPLRWYWMLFIIARKFMLAFTALMFRSNPGFQLSLVVLIMFYSFVLQVRFQPYLYRGDYKSELELHSIGRKNPTSVHALIHGPLANWQRERARKMKGLIGRQLAIPRKDQNQFGQLIDGLVNYNTIESTLLMSAVLVALSGVMFQAAQFTMSDASTEADFIGVLVGIIVVSSIVYFCLVLWVDVMSFLKSDLIFRLFTKRNVRKTAKTDADSKKKKDALAMEAINPMHKANVPTSDPVEASREARKQKLGIPGFDLETRKAKEEGIQMNTNAMMAAGARTNMSSDELRAENMPEDVPSDAMYQIYVKRFVEMEKEVERIMAERKMKVKSTTQGAKK